MPESVCILISDIHYDLNTLELADAAMRQAIGKASELDIPLVVAGDLHNTKANMRAECVNALIKTFNECPPEQVYVMVGNHDKVNEKSSEHALNFLEPYAQVVKSPTYIASIGCYAIPYHHDVEELRSCLASIPKSSTLIMHQGIEGSNAGDYIQDKSALKHEDVCDFRVISGHYHQRQDIKIGRPRKGAVGLWSYIGNPYTVNYGEAKDPEKGFQILMSDSTLEFVPTNLRKHIVYEANLHDRSAPPKIASGDLLLVKMHGSKEDFSRLDKNIKWDIAESLGYEGIDFRLELIPTDTPNNSPINTQYTSQVEMLDAIISQLSDTSEERKERLKELWKNLV